MMLLKMLGIKLMGQGAKRTQKWIGLYQVDQRTDGDIQKESKALRHFCAALVDFVKDLLEPTWREGHLSEDAHNTIVKKTVEKVLFTLLSHQVPSTTESINQYLSSSWLKITKFVEAYVKIWRCKQLFFLDGCLHIRVSWSITFCLSSI